MIAMLIIFLQVYCEPTEEEKYSKNLSFTTKQLQNHKDAVKTYVRSLLLFLS